MVIVTQNFFMFRQLLGEARIELMAFIMTRGLGLLMRTCLRRRHKASLKDFFCGDDTTQGGTWGRALPVPTLFEKAKLL